VTDLLLPGIASRRVPTRRLTINVLDDGRPGGEPVLFIHGNVSSALFFQTTLLALPEGFRGIALDLRGFGDTDPEPVDATRGLADYSDDVAALIDALELDRPHVVGWSMGSGVALQLLLDHAERLASLTLIAPVSPYGFGGTRDADGTPLSSDGAGTGGGTVNPDFVARLAAGDTSDEASTSPRQVLRAHYVKPPFVPAQEDIYVASMLSTRTGENHYPGDLRPTEAWPQVAAGDRGVLNTMSPTHLRLDGIDRVRPKPPILWIRGDSDVIISDTSAYDLAYLGSLGAVPDWPGIEQVPPQPMVTQTRAVLRRYADAGGSYREVVITEAGHSPFLEKPEDFLAALTDFLRGV
jgi:pimeloyl-ACP methyl ester carboxylesterase